MSAGVLFSLEIAAGAASVALAWAFPCCWTSLALAVVAGVAAVGVVVRN